MIKTRGGKRKGAGRKPAPEALRKKNITVRIPIWLVNWLDQQGYPYSDVIEFTLKRYYNLKQPDLEKDNA